MKNKSAAVPPPPKAQRLSIGWDFKAFSPKMAPTKKCGGAPPLPITYPLFPLSQHKKAPLQQRGRKTQLLPRRVTKGLGKILPAGQTPWSASIGACSNGYEAEAAAAQPRSQWSSDGLGASPGDDWRRLSRSGKPAGRPRRISLGRRRVPSAGNGDQFAAYVRLFLAETLIALNCSREAEQEILAALPTIEEQKMVPEGLAAVALLKESVRRRKTDRNALRELREHLQVAQKK